MLYDMRNGIILAPTNLKLHVMIFHCIRILRKGYFKYRNIRNTLGSKLKRRNKQFIIMSRNVPRLCITFSAMNTELE